MSSVIDAGPTTQTSTMNEEFAAAMRAARENAGMTQAELARILNRHFTTVSGWERARNGNGNGNGNGDERSEPPRAAVFAMEDAFGLAPGTLSRLLGYLPITAARTPPTLEDFLSTKAYSEHRKNIIRSLIRDMDESSPGGRRGP